MAKNIIANHGISVRLAAGYLCSYLIRLYELGIPILRFTQAKSDLLWLRYDQNGNIIASRSNSGRLADGQLVG